MVSYRGRGRAVFPDAAMPLSSEIEGNVCGGVSVTGSCLKIHTGVPGIEDGDAQTREILLTFRVNSVKPCSKAVAAITHRQRQVAVRRFCIGPSRTPQRSAMDCVTGATDPQTTTARLRQ